MSRCLRRVQRDWLAHHPPRFVKRPYHIELIISYCEMAHHEGTAYRAASFQSIGLTNDDTKEIYLKRLRPPRRSWRIDDWPGQIQLPLLDDTGMRYWSKGVCYE